MPECWLSASRAEHHPGRCSRSRECPSRLLHTSSPQREGFPNFQGLLQSPRKGMGTASCLGALLSPQMPISSAAKHFHKFPASQKGCGPQPTGRSYLGLGNDLAINLGRNPSWSHLKFSIKGTPMRHLDIMAIWQLCRTHLTAELCNDKYRDRPTPLPHIH